MFVKVILKIYSCYSTWTYSKVTRLDLGMSYQNLITILFHFIIVFIILEGWNLKINKNTMIS